LSKLTLKQ